MMLSILFLVSVFSVHLSFMNMRHGAFRSNDSLETSRGTSANQPSTASKSNSHKQSSGTNPQLSTSLTPQWVPMAPPNYYIDPQHLVSSSVQKFAWYLTTLMQNPTTFQA